MRTYAYVPTVPGLVHAVETFEPITEDGVARDPVLGVDIIHPSDAPKYIDVTALSPQPQQGWSYDGRVFVPPAAPDPSPANKAHAQALLDASDITILRCAENSVAVPAAWASYRAALRAIASAGTVPTAGWPAKPAYPAGT